MATGRSYKDPVYDQIEARLGEKYGPVVQRLVTGIRLHGERSNSDQVSEAGARTVYQVIPSTRRLFASKYGVDAYASIEGAAETAFLHVRDSLKRNKGDEAAAVHEYVGGPDRSKWGDTVTAYGRRVSGAGEGYTPGTPDAEPLKDFSGDWLHSEQTAEVTPHHEHIAKETDEAKRQRRLKAQTGRTDLYADTTVDNRDVGATEVRTGQIAAAEQTEKDEGITPWQRLAASWQDNTLTASILRHLDDTHFKPAQGFVDQYMKNRDEIEKGYDDNEVGQLREAVSLDSLTHIKSDIEASRARQALYTSRGVSGTEGVLYSLMGGIADPVGIAAGEGVGKIMQMTGMGARALYAARRPVLGTLAQAGEFAAGNVAITGGMDAAGDYTTSQDYAQAAGFGAAMGLALAPFHWRSHGPTVEDHFAGQVENAKAEQSALMEEAQQAAGPGASEEDVLDHAQRIDAQRRSDGLSAALADQPDELKVMSADNVLTADEAVRNKVIQDNGLDGLSDEGERNTGAEMTARLNRIVDDNPIDQSRLNPLTVGMKLQSTGIDLLKSKSKVLRGIGLILTEGTTGAGGRRVTGALVQHARMGAYLDHLRGYSDLYHLYRKEKGTGILTEAWNGRRWKEFEREVALEIERRGDETGYIPHENRLIREAADKAEQGFDAMRMDQQHVGTVGNARLGLDSKGYLPHRVLGAKLATLTTEQRRNVTKEYSRQFQANEGFDKKFSDRLATKYVEQAVRRAKGGTDVPMNLHSPDASDMMEDAIRAMGLPPEELNKLLGKYSRGGASHTKKRLKLDLDKDIGDGMKLIDLYNTSVSDLYRGYARRVSGEVALAQFGIMGRKGLSTLRALAETTGASNEDLRAFDQISAEFLNAPFGEHNHKWMDNARIAASLARLGGMGFTQLGEYGNGLIALGVRRVFSSMGDMPRLMGEVRAIHKGGAKPNPILKSLDDQGAHVGLDDYTMTGLFRVPDQDIQMYGTEAVGLGTRLLRAGGNLQAILSGHRMILAVQVRGMAEQIIRKAVHYAKTGAEDAALDDMGINAELRARLRANMDKIATFKGDSLQDLDLHAGDLTGHELQTLRAAVMRGSGQIIQRTYIGETGAWAHDGFLKLLTQFRTFGITSVEKQWGRTRGTHGALKSFAYTLGAMSFAAPIYMARVQAKMVAMDKDKADDYAAKHLTPFAIAAATLNYASSTGLTGDIMDMGIGFSGGLGLDLPDDVAARGRQRGGFIGGQIAPGVGLVNDVYSGVSNLRTPDGDLNKGSIQKIERAMPGANLPFVQPLLNSLAPSD